MLTIVLLYAVFLGVGWLAGRKNPDRAPADFIVAGRTMPLWLAAFTMTATWVDGGYLLGTAEGVYQTGIATGIQGGVCFGISLIVGGILFPEPDAALGFSTLIDLSNPASVQRWAAVLSLPAMLAEVSGAPSCWSRSVRPSTSSSASISPTAILLAAVVTVYTMMGGMWSVAYTDVLQLGLVVLGLVIALPYILDAVGGLALAWDVYAPRGPTPRVLPPLPATPASGPPAIVLLVGRQPHVDPRRHSLELLLPARPVLPHAARRRRIRSSPALLTMALAIPPLLLGMAAATV